MNSAQYQLSLYNMTAPISGVVEAVNLTLNNFAASGTVAFVISNGSNKTVTFYVTDQVRQTLTAGQEVSVVSDGRTYQGAVTEISGVVDAATPACSRSRRSSTRPSPCLTAWRWN